MRGSNLSMNIGSCLSLNLNYSGCSHLVNLSSPTPTPTDAISKTNQKFTKWISQNYF